MNDDGIGDKTRDLKVKSLVNSLRDSAVSEEIEFLIEIPEAKSEESNNGDDWHTTAEDQAHVYERNDFSIVALNLKFLRQKLLLHLSLNLFSLCSAVRDFFVEAVEEGHTQSRMEDKDDSVE